MKILITGGTGFIGSSIIRKLLDKDHEVILLTRNARGARNRLGSPGVSFVEYGYKPDSIIPDDIMSEADGIINMAGEPIFTGRWTAKKKQDIEASRVNITRQLVDSLARLKEKGPETLVSASAVGYYGPRDDTEITEDYPSGSDFMSKAAFNWEKEALKAESLGIRTVVLRTGIVIEKGGGALAKMTLPFKLFIGGPVGTGRQYFSWIHMDDITDLYIRALTDKKLSGPVNATAPNPVTMKEMSKALGSVLNRPSWFPVPGFLAKIVIGGSAEIVVTSQRVIPDKLQSMGYRFKYENIEDALRASLL